MEIMQQLLQKELVQSYFNPMLSRGDRQRFQAETNAERGCKTIRLRLHVNPTSYVQNLRRRSTTPE